MSLPYFFFWFKCFNIPGCRQSSAFHIHAEARELAEREICAAIARADCFQSGRQKRSARKKQIKYISRVLCRPKVVVEILGNPLRRRNIYAGPFIYTTLSNAKSNGGGTAIFHRLLIRTLCAYGVGYAWHCDKEESS